MLAPSATRARFERTVSSSSPPGPYVAVYLAEQKWTQENIGFVLTETSQHSSIEKIGSVKAVQPNQFTLRKYRC